MTGRSRKSTNLVIYYGNSPLNFRFHGFRFCHHLPNNNFISLFDTKDGPKGCDNATAISVKCSKFIFGENSTGMTPPPPLRTILTILDPPLQMSLTLHVPYPYSQTRYTHLDAWIQVLSESSQKVNVTSVLVLPLYKTHSQAKYWHEPTRSSLEEEKGWWKP